MTILEEINARKKEEVANSKAICSIQELKGSKLFTRDTLSMVSSIASKETAIISEFKKKSPSKGIIHQGADAAKITKSYTEAGCAGLSVLTDGHYFGGSHSDLQESRDANPITPILRKDFMIDPYQIYEAKAWGADAILLIAASLTSKQIGELSHLAHELGLEVLLEVHDLSEIKKSPFDNVDIIGVNNRNLKNFSESNVNASLELFDSLPQDKIKISESCLSEPQVVQRLKGVGYEGFLIGESFMKTKQPGNSLATFIKACNS